MNNAEILATLKAALDKAFPNIVARIILFGSRTNGGATEDSDRDILIVLSENYDWKFRKQIRYVCYEVALNLGVVFDTKLITLDELDSARGSVQYIHDTLTQAVTA